MSTPHGRRVCQIIQLKPGAEDEYRALHAAVWPGVLAALARHHIADYSIHLHAPLRLLVARFTYTGADYAADMRALAADAATRRWWAATDPLQESLVAGAQGSGGAVPWWLDLEEVFYSDGHPPDARQR